MNNLVLSHFQTAPILKQQEKIGNQITFSPDLNNSLIEGIISPEGVEIPGSEILSWEAIQEIDATPNNCFAIVDGIPRENPDLFGTDQQHL